MQQDFGAICVLNLISIKVHLRPVAHHSTWAIHWSKWSTFYAAAFAVRSTNSKAIMVFMRKN